MFVVGIIHMLEALAFRCFPKCFFLFCCLTSKAQGIKAFAVFCCLWMGVVHPWELLACVVARMYLDEPDSSLGLTLLDLLGAVSSWSVWASRCGPAVVAQLELKLTLRSLDEYLDLCDSLSADELPENASRNAVLPLFLRHVSLRLRKQEFHEVIEGYEALVKWLRGAEPPQEPQDVLVVDELDRERARAEMARRGERSGVGAAELALRIAEQYVKSFGGDASDLAKEAAALAAEMGDAALVKRATALAGTKRKEEKTSITTTIPPAASLQPDEMAEMLRALEAQDHEYFLK
jgi:hypothetical protein